MGSSNKGKGRQHINVLKPSTPDIILLCDAVDHRFREVCHLHHRVKGEQLIPPAMYDRDMLLWRQMFIRHRQHDNRNTVDERNAVRRIAQWTLDVKRQLTDQPPLVLQWSD